MPYEPVESKRVYQLAKAADSIGANIAEAGGRFHPNDVRNFFYFARGSLRETKYWLRRAVQRGLVPPEKGASLDEELEQLAREISQCISFQKQRIAQS